MRATQQFSITLPNEMAAEVERRVQSGAYASVSEVVREGVRALLDRDAAVEKWLREEVVKSIDEYNAHPNRGISSDRIMSRIRDLAARTRTDRSA